MPFSFLSAFNSCKNRIELSQMRIMAVVRYLSCSFNVIKKMKKTSTKVKLIRSKVYTHMLETRGWKYRSFLRHLRIFKYLAFSPVRGEFLESYYTLMRYLDDIVDGDAPLPEGYSCGYDYLLEKIEFSQCPSIPKDETDELMLYCFELAKRFDEDFQSETKDILDSLLFDSKRRSTGKIFPEEELNYHFHQLDIRGTIRATLKIFKDNPEKYLLLEPLGKACRFEYDIEDFESDIKAGYVNISQEECTRFMISPEDLQNSASPKIQAWLCHHAQEGLNLLEAHHRNLPKGNFTVLERLVFRYVYEKPARKTFEYCLAKSTNRDSKIRYEQRYSQ